MKILISGGAKNGKSMYAQKIAKAMSVEYDVPLYYVATMEPTDEEDENRIKRHVQDRAGWGFTTIEEPQKLVNVFDARDIGFMAEADNADNVYNTDDADNSDNADNANNLDIKCMGKPHVNPKGVFLVDSLTALLGNNMFKKNGSMKLDCFDEVRDDIYSFSTIASNIVMVSDSIGCDGIIFDQITEAYRKSLARLEREIASYYDRVTEVSVGQIIEFK